HQERVSGTGKQTPDTPAPPPAHAVPRNQYNPGPLRHCFGIDGVESSRQCRGTERHDVDPLPNIVQALAVPRQHFKISQTPVSEQNRLGALQMGVPGQNNLLISLGKKEKRCLRLAQETIQLIDFPPQPEAKVSCDLIVAAAARMQFATCGAKHFYQTRFDERMHVFRIWIIQVELFRQTTFKYLLERRLYLLSLVVKQNVCHGQALAMLDTGTDINLKTPPIKSK